jgi:mRNA interferase MazF
MGMVNRFGVFLVNLDPTVGAEIKKTRPCVVISPDELNTHMGTVIVSPMTTAFREIYPFRVNCNFQGKDGQIVLDQIRAVDKNRLVKRLGTISKSEQEEVLKVLLKMFAP